MQLDTAVVAVESDGFDAWQDRICDTFVPLHARRDDGPEADFLGASVGPNGIDLQGYVIDRIGFRLDSLTLSTPGTDPNGNGQWTDFALSGAVLFEGRPFTREWCMKGGWRNYFKNQGDCVSYVSTKFG